MTPEAKPTVHPWITFTGICALVIGIVLFSVIVGGYSSLLRATKRIETAKGMLAAQFERQVHAVADLAGCPGNTMESDICSSFSRMNSIFLDTESKARQKDWTGLFESAQSELSLYLEDNVASISLEKINETLLFIVRQYNRESRYFNRRSKSFPTVISARLFGLDRLWFPEINIPRRMRLTQGDTSDF